VPDNFKSMADCIAATKTWSKPVVAAEIASGAISSPGFFQSGTLALAGPGTLANTPWARWGDLKTQGTVVHTVTPTSTTAQFRVCVASASPKSTDGTPRNGATITINAGTPGIASVTPPS
jgi:hypothetical protein